MRIFALICCFVFSLMQFSAGISQDLFAKGADVSWLPQMEASGYIFKDLDGNPKDCLVKKYGKEVMVVETGGEVSKVDNTYNLLEATLRAVRAVPDQKGLGVLYWEPEGVQSWSRYGLNAWLENGQPSRALLAFKD